MTTTAPVVPAAAQEEAEIKPLSPEDLRTGPAFMKQVAALVKLCNERLTARDRVVVIGAHVPNNEIREVVSRFSAIGWAVKRSKKKDDANAIELHFREKRKPSSKPATTRKKGAKKPPAAPPVDPTTPAS